MDAEAGGDAELYEEPAPGQHDLELPERPEDIALSDQDEAEIRRRAPVVPNDVASMLVVALVRAGVPVGVSHLRKLFWARPITPAEVEHAASRSASTTRIGCCSTR